MADNPKKYHQPLTVGELRRQLAEFHESELVALGHNNLLYHPSVEQTHTIIGRTVVISLGERFSV